MDIKYLDSEENFRLDPEDTEDSGWGSIPSDDSDWATKGDDYGFGDSLSTLNED